MKPFIINFHCQNVSTLLTYAKPKMYGQSYHIVDVFSASNRLHLVLNTEHTASVSLSYPCVLCVCMYDLLVTYVAVMYKMCGLTHRSACVHCVYCRIRHLIASFPSVNFKKVVEITK